MREKLPPLLGLLALAGGRSFCSSPEASQPGPGADATVEHAPADVSADKGDGPAPIDAGEDVYGIDWDDGTGSDGQNIRRLLRFETSALDALETAW